MIRSYLVPGCGTTVDDIIKSFVDFSASHFPGSMKFSTSGKFSYKLSFFVIKKINLIDIKSNKWKIFTFGKGKRKLTAFERVL